MGELVDTTTGQPTTRSATDHAAHSLIHQLDSATGLPVAGESTSGTPHALDYQLDSTTVLPVAQNSTDGSAHVRTTASDVAFPEQDTPQVLITQTATASATVYTSTDISGYNCFAFEAILAGTTPALKAYPSFDGGANFASVPMALVNLNDNTVIDGDTGATATGVYALLSHGYALVKPSNIKLILTAGAADGTLTLRGTHGNS